MPAEEVVVIYKKSWREFDREYSELSQWPLELAYKLYDEMMDNLIKLQEEKNEEVVDSSDSISDADK
jgi:hypothetical protein